MNAIRQVQALNKRELENAVPPEASWHADYRDTAYIYIGSLPYDLSEGDILTIFSQFGEPVHLNLVRDKDTGKSKGFAFLKYEDQRSTDLAVDNLGGATVLGRMISVDHVRYKRREAEGLEDNLAALNRIEEGPEAGKGEDGGERKRERRRRRSRSGSGTDDGRRRRPLLKEEKELALLMEEHDEEDPMKEFLIQEKKEEVALARQRADKSKHRNRDDGERRERHRRHHHRHRHQRRSEDRSRSGDRRPSRRERPTSRSRSPSVDRSERRRHRDRRDRSR